MSVQDSLRALKDAFPTIDPAQLQLTLQSCNFNVEMAAEQTLRSMEGEGARPAAAKQLRTPGKMRPKVRTTEYDMT
jgi:hypothetical protein